MASTQTLTKKPATLRKPATPKRAVTPKKPVAPRKPVTRDRVPIPGVLARNAERALRVSEEMALWVVRMLRTARRRLHGSTAA